MGAVKERMLEFIQLQGLSVKRFETMCGLSNGYMGSMRKGMGSQKLEQVLKVFPRLSREWVLFGRGAMLLPDPAEANDERLVVTEENGIKFYPELFVTGTNVEGFDNELYQDYNLLYVPGLGGCSAFPAVGESMMPTVVPGNIVVHKTWTERYIENGELYVVITRSGNRMIKRLTLLGYADDGAMQIKCWSDNPDQERYAPFVLDGNEIHSLSLVKMIIPRMG